MRSVPVPDDTLLVLEPDSEGHTQEWLQHLIDHAAAGETPRLEIVASPALCDALRPGVAGAGAGGRVVLTPLSPVEQRYCTHRRLAVSGLARWWAMRRHLRRSGARHGLFLSIDHLSLPLALGLRVGGGRVSGILFRPSVHYAAIGSYHPGRGERLRDLRKALLYRLMLRNPALDAVLSLDPYFADHAVRRYTGGGKVVTLPDPAHHPSALAPAADGFADYVPPGRVGFFLFGHITRRKGVIELLEGLWRLDRDTAARVAVVVAGRVDPDLKAGLDAMRRHLEREQPSLWLRIEDRRLDDTEIDALIERSDVVLAPYQRFVGSSGVLLWAARVGRPVLTQEFGLIGRLTRDHGLGIATDSSNPACLAAAIEHIVATGARALLDEDGARRFVAPRTPRHFASMVMDRARNAST